MFARKPRQPPQPPSLDGPSASATTAATVLPLPLPRHPVQTMLLALLHELAQDVSTPRNPSPMPGAMALFVRSGVPMGERLVCSMTPDQCEKVSDLVRQWSERLEYERQQYRDQLEQRRA